MPRIDLPFIVEKQHITQPTREVLISGGRNYFYATFIIDEIWANIPSLKAVFVRDDVNKLVDLTETESGYECEIPWEVIVDKGILHVGIFGGDRLLTNYAYVVVKQGCVTEGEVPKPPTEDWFIKIEGEIEEIRENGGGGGGIAEEKDPTVPEWAKQPTKPTYTAEEVGAVSKDGDEEISGVKKFNDSVDIKKISTEDFFSIEALSGVRIWADAGTILEGVGGQLYLYNGAEFTLTGDLKVNGEVVALKKDITPVALREVSTHNADTNSHSDIRDRLNIVESVAEGAGISETFDNYAEMVSALNEADKSKYKKGRNINIITVGVPDLWVAYVSDTPAAYNYTTDEAFVEELKASGTIQVGYFKLAMLETQKVDLADYAKKEDVTSALGGCIFKQVSQEEYDAMFAEGTLIADVIYIVGGNANAS